MKDAFGQCNLFQIKQNPVLFTILPLDYKCLRYYFIFAFKLDKSIHCLANFAMKKIVFYLFS
jgi:hypothetical protein